MHEWMNEELWVNWHLALKGKILRRFKVEMRNETMWQKEESRHQPTCSHPAVLGRWVLGVMAEVELFSVCQMIDGRRLLGSPQLRFLLQLWTAVPSHVRSIYCLPRVGTFTLHLWDLGRSLLYPTLCTAWESWEKFLLCGANQHGSHKIAASPRPSLGEQFCSSSWEPPVGLGPVAHSSQ